VADRSQAVKTFYENTGTYLNQDYNIRIRAETVQGFTEGMQFNSAIDIPCGNGAISISLLGQVQHLTMVDFTQNMINTARKEIPPGESEKVTFINDDILALGLPENSFSLVVSLGVLAHIASPEKLVDIITNLVKPGGYLIVQNTDANHRKGRLIHTYASLKRLLGKSSYRMNRVSGKWLEAAIKEKGFHLAREFRYNQSFLGLGRFYSNEKKYQITRNRFGNHANNSNADKGADALYLFRKDE